MAKEGGRQRLGINTEKEERLNSPDVLCSNCSVPQPRIEVKTGKRHREKEQRRMQATGRKWET